MAATADRRYSITPLVEAMAIDGSVTRALGISGATLQTHTTFGMPERTAERLAMRAGFLPYEVWPDMLDAAIADIEVECAAGDCTIRFVPPPTGPGQKRKRYHSRGCQVRWNHRRRYRDDPSTRERRKAAARRYKREIAELERRRQERAA